MLQLVMSHWLMAIYLPAVVVLFILFVMYRNKSVIVYRKICHLPARTRTIIVAGWRKRPRLRHGR